MFLFKVVGRVAACSICSLPKNSKGLERCFQPSVPQKIIKCRIRFIMDPGGMGLQGFPCSMQLMPTRAEWHNFWGVISSQLQYILMKSHGYCMIYKEIPHITRQKSNLHILIQGWSYWSWCSKISVDRRSSETMPFGYTLNHWKLWC